MLSSLASVRALFGEKPAFPPEARLRPAAALSIYGNQSHSPMESFKDIQVAPNSAENGMVFDGGPLWPDWKNRGYFRHNRSGLPADHASPAPAADPELVDTPSVWGGHIVDHFGHFIVEPATRLLQSRYEHPDKDYLFCIQPKLAHDKIPSFFWQIIAWYGLPASQVKLVTRPMEVGELWAAPMAEQWSNAPLSQRYLDLLDRNTAERRLTARTAEIVYVSRDRMENSAEGHNAGEAYLARCLGALGVKVIRPETMSLTDQLAHYQGARLLIFSEGSAMHGRQLLGRVDQDVVVLNRRPNMRIGMISLQPRVSSIAYAEVTRGTVSVMWPGGVPWVVRALSIYDEDNLISVFSSLGIPLASVWNKTNTWLHATPDSSVGCPSGSTPDRRRTVRRRLRTCGATCRLWGWIITPGWFPKSERTMTKKRVSRLFWLLSARHSPM